MSLAAAIAEATGLDPSKDFIVQDDGDGAYIKNWDSVRLGPTPTQEQIAQYLVDYEAKQPQRTEAEFVQSITREYIVAMIYNDLLADSTKLTALIAKVAARPK